MRKGEDHMNIGRSQKFAAACLQPTVASGGLTLGTVPIATRNGVHPISCLMGSIFFGGVERQRGVLQAVSRPFDSPLRVALQKREQFVGWPEPALAEAGRHNRFNGLQLFSRVGSNLNLRRGQTTVPQPQ